ncbi:MAG: thymidine kinase [Elusimicrobia bacterium GWF2_52_66]|nr:MAG: thymidine kinase [Elusimicrobia bacterium GWA2_51_34]OGR88421.1 MAG: thymidine kinase [Elusimicrobia bacterium GWF2_52_66]HAF95022.1 thymidine kinase [Elusimicrobiota bacterium]HCE97961.1 thymidine kinase [Elusimicrobiota bacterium]
MIFNVSSGSGWIEVVCGSMFSGKTQELIRRLKLANIARQKVQVFNSHLDTRYSKEHLVSHDKLVLAARPVKTAKEILKEIAPDTQVVGIDETHFFGEEIVEVCQELANSGKRVIAAGLDQDYRGEAFLNMARLMAVAEFITKNLAICMVCGNPAHFSQRLAGSSRRIEVGSGEKYEARCRKCFKPEK